MLLATARKKHGEEHLASSKVTQAMIKDKSGYISSPRRMRGFGSNSPDKSPNYRTKVSPGKSQTLPVGSSLALAGQLSKRGKLPKLGKSKSNMLPKARTTESTTNKAVKAFHKSAATPTKGSFRGGTRDVQATTQFKKSKLAKKQEASPVRGDLEKSVENKKARQTQENFPGHV